MMRTMDLQVSCVWDMERKGNKANDANNGPASIMRVGHGKEGEQMMRTMDLQVSCVWDMERKGNKANDANNGPASIMRVGHGKEGEQSK